MEWRSISEEHSAFSIEHSAFRGTSVHVATASRKALAAAHYQIVHVGGQFAGIKSPVAALRQE
jgi:hypothetical protein